MGSRAKTSGIRLTSRDASIVKGMLARGDRQHDIAAWFGVNGGRIAEISKGVTFADVRATNEELPPVGPYPSGRNSIATKMALESAITALSKTSDQLRQQLTDL